MELILNELSVRDLAGTPDDARQAMNNLLQLCKKAKDEMGFRHLRLQKAGIFNEELVLDYTLIQWLNDSQVSRTLRDFFSSLWKYPYFESEEEELENQIILSKFLLNEPEHTCNGEEVEGLAAAWLKRTLAVSFCSHPVWSKNKIGLTIDWFDAGTEDVEVYNACTESCLDDDFKEWFRKINLPPLQTHEDVDVWFSPDEGYQLSVKAKDDLISWYQQNQQDKIDKIETFFKEIWIDPFRGTGQIEPLSENLSGWWSRRIDQEHRLVYKFENGTLHVCSCKGHYTDLSCD